MDVGENMHRAEINSAQADLDALITYEMAISFNFFPLFSVEGEGNQNQIASVKWYPISFR